MSDTVKGNTRTHRFDRPSENQATKDTKNAPWHDDARNANDTSQHRRYHSLFEDLMN